MLVSGGKEYELTSNGTSVVGNPANSAGSDVEAQQATPAAASSNPADSLTGSTKSSKKDGKSANSDDDTDDSSTRGNKGLPGTRWTSLFMLLLWGLCLIFREVHSVTWAHGADCNDIVDESGNEDDDALLQSCRSHSAIYRVTTMAIVILLLQAFLTLCSVNFYDYYWWIKFPFFALSSFALLYPNGATGFDDEGFTWVARIGAFLFIIFQQVILLDWAYSINEYMTADARVKENARGLTQATVGSDIMDVMKRTDLICLLLFSFLNIAIFCTAMGLLFEYFGGAKCGENTTILTISLVGMIAAAVIQLGGSNGSLITTSILSLYVAYLSYAAVSLNPDGDCNASLADNSDGAKSWTYGLGPSIIGMIVCFLSIVWVSVVTSRKITNVMNVGLLPGTALFSIIVGKSSGSKGGGITGTKVNFKEQLRTSVLNLNFIFCLICFYIAMVMTNWGTLVETKVSSGKSGGDMATSVAAGSVSMWMQAVGAWVAIALYIVALLIPNFSSCMPRSVWDLQFNQS